MYTTELTEFSAAYVKSIGWATEAFCAVAGMPAPRRSPPARMNNDNFFFMLIIHLFFKILLSVGVRPICVSCMIGPTLWGLFFKLSAKI